MAAGGRPPFPLELLEGFFRDPKQYLEHKQYRDVVLYEHRHGVLADKRYFFYGFYWRRWEMFCKLQRIIRARALKNERILIECAGYEDWDRLAELYGPLEGEWGFSQYRDTVSRRLAKYGFARPFNPHADADQQDKLTTWIEYLGFQYFYHDRPASFVKRFRQRHDDAWEKLVGSNVLAPEETYEVVCDIRTRFRQSAELDRAKDAMETAAAAVSSVEQNIAKSAHSTGILEKQLVAYQSTLSVATRKYRTLQTKDDAINEFFQKLPRGYHGNKDDADRSNHLLRWIEQQIPVIESELRSSQEDGADEYQSAAIKAFEDVQTVEPSQSADSRVKRHAVAETHSQSVQKAFSSSNRATGKRSRQNTTDNESSTKRRKKTASSVLHRDPEPEEQVEATSTPATDPKRNQKIKNANASGGDHGRRSAPLRRSARIAKKSQEAACMNSVPTAPAVKAVRTSRRGKVEHDAPKRTRKPSEGKARRTTTKRPGTSTAVEKASRPRKAKRVPQEKSDATDGQTRRRGPSRAAKSARECSSTT